MADRHPVGRGYPDPYIVATTKLSQEWSANRCVPQLNDQWLDSLLSDDRFGAIDPMVKVRLLLAGMLAINQPAYQGNEDAAFQLQGVLGKLQQAAATDADEWVKVMAAATGHLDGRLDLDAVMQQSAVVQETMTNLQQQVQESTNQHLYPPLEDLFLTRTPTSLNPDSGHFQLRQNPRVQPLATSIGSYSNATPPPPALQSPKPGEHGAAFPRPQSRLHKQPSLGRTESGTIADGASPAVGRTVSLKPGMAPRAPKIQLLGEAEQAEMSDVLQKSLKAKGHGVAASVRHEHVQARRPRKAEGEQQQGEGAGEAVLEAMEQGMDERRVQEAAAGGGGRRGDRGGPQQQQQPGQQQQRAGCYYSSAKAGGGGGGRSGSFNRSAAAAAAAAAREAAIDEEIDELFEDRPGDDDDDFIVKGCMESHISRSTKGLVRHARGASQDIEAPAELLDDVSDEPVGENMEGVEQETITAAAAVREEGEGQWEGRGSGENGGVGSAATKRRRFIVEDEDDDD